LFVACLVCIIFLYFKLFGALCYFLFFPTRRSSDLAYLFRRTRVGLVRRRVTDRRWRLGHRDQVSQSPRAATPKRMSTASPSRRLDRKSTRLNSSHLGISYAVFCLKKKNKTRYTTNI